jgi:hypothetical protein
MVRKTQSLMGRLEGSHDLRIGAQGLAQRGCSTSSNTRLASREERFLGQPTKEVSSTLSEKSENVFIAGHHIVR